MIDARIPRDLGFIHFSKLNKLADHLIFGAPFQIQKIFLSLCLNRNSRPSLHASCGDTDRSTTFSTNFIVAMTASSWLQAGAQLSNARASDESRFKVTASKFGFSEPSKIQLPLNEISPQVSTASSYPRLYT